MRPEKMVNLLLAEGISLHNIERENKSTITAVTETGNCMPLIFVGLSDSPCSFAILMETFAKSGSMGSSFASMNPRFVTKEG